MTGRVASATVRLRRGDELAQASFGAEGALDAFEREAGGELLRAELHAAHWIDRLLAGGRKARAHLEQVEFAAYALELPLPESNELDFRQVARFLTHVRRYEHLVPAGLVGDA